MDRVQKHGIRNTRTYTEHTVLNIFSAIDVVKIAEEEIFHGHDILSIHLFQAREWSEERLPIA